MDRRRARRPEAATSPREGDRWRTHGEQEGSGYERLGASEAFAMATASPSPWDSSGPCSATAFVIPLIDRVCSARLGRARGSQRPLPCSSPRSASSRWAGSSRSTRNGSMRPGSLYDYVSNGLGSNARRGGRMALLRRHDRLDGRPRRSHRRIHPRHDPHGVQQGTAAGMGMERDLHCRAVLRPVLGGEALDAGATRRSRSSRCSSLLAFFIYVIAKVGSGNDLGKAFDPTRIRHGESERGPLRRPLRGAHLRRVRDGGEPGGGDVATEATDPEGRPPVGGHRLGLLPDRLLRAGRRVRFQTWRRSRLPTSPRRRCSRSVRRCSAYRITSSGSSSSSSCST